MKYVYLLKCLAYLPTFHLNLLEQVEVWLITPYYMIIDYSLPCNLLILNFFGTENQCMRNDAYLFFICVHHADYARLSAFESVDRPNETD